jgi:hypothetical protein
MTTNNEPYYTIYKPPLILVNPQKRFVCAVCGRPGKGPANARVHPGRCREEHNRRIAKKNAANSREKRGVSAA